MNKIGKLMVLALGLWSGAANAATGKSEVFQLDLREGDRISAGTEELTFSNLWDGDEGATVTIAQDGEAIFEGLSGEGVKTWSVNRNGRYVLTHTTYTNGVPGKVETAVFVVEGKDVPVGELTIDWDSGSYKYDGNGKMPGVTAKDGEKSLVKGADYTVHYESNTNAGTAKAILTGLPPYVGSVTNEFTIAKRSVTLTSGTKEWTYDGDAHSYETVTISGDGFVSGEGVTTNGFSTIKNVGSVPNAFSYAFLPNTLAANYAVTCVTGTLTVVKGDLPPGDDPDPTDPSVDPDDPEQREDPDVRFSAFDYVGMYDGAAHTIDTNALKQAYEAVLGAGVACMYARAQDGEWTAEPLVFRDAVVTSFWYKVTSANYNDIVKHCKVAITNRCVTLASGTDQWTYDGNAHSNLTVTVSGEGFVSGEGVTTNGFATITDVGSVPNSFAYSFLPNTLAANYAVTCVTGMLTVVKGDLPPGDDPDPIDPSVDPDDPGQREDPDVRFSKFDYVGMYDGEAHTIDTNALKVAYEAALGAGVACMYARAQDGEWAAEPVTLKDAVVTSFWYKVTSANYSDIVKPCKVVITNRLVTLTSGTQEWTYDSMAHSNLTVAVSGDGFVSGEGVTTNGFATITDVGEKDNTFSWSFAEGTLAKNYAVTVSYGKLKVNARPIGDDDKNWDIRLDKAPMYNGEVQNAPIIQVCYVKPDGNLDYIPYTLAGNTATDAGNYKVKISGTGNYTGTVEKDWAIMPRNIKMTSGTAEWMYDGEAHSNDTVTVSGDGFVDGEGATYEGFPQVTHVTDAAEPIENAFTYKLNDNTKQKNYEIVTEKGKVAMVRRPIALTAPTKSKPYDGTPLTFAANEVGIGGEGYAEGEAFALSGFASITEAGQVAATFNLADGTALQADYDITVTPGATLTVMKSATEITVMAKSKSWTYDGTPHELHEYEATNLNILQPGEELVVTFKESSVVTTPCDGVAQDGRVPNEIESVRVVKNGSQDVTGNYTLAWYPGTLMVTKRPVTLTSKSDKKTYDGTPLTKHEVEIGGDGFVGEDGATCTYTGAQTEKGKSANAFTYALKSGTNAAYYEITKVEGELEVEPADISTGTEQDWQVVLGPALTYNGIAQIQTVTSVKFKGLDVDYTVAGNQQTDAGNYELTLTGQGNFTGEKRVAWSIAPKALTLTAQGGQKPYDGIPLAVNAVTADGFVAGEEAAYVCKGSQLDVGGSANEVETIDWTKAKAGNYAVTKKTGTLTVTPRAVTVTSKNISKPYDGTPLKLTAADISADNLVAGESFVYGDFAERTSAGQASATFSIAAGANTKLANYAITPVYGTITITKSAAEIGVTARSKSWQYDTTTHELHEYDATNLNILQPGEELVVTFKETSVVATPCDGIAQDGRVPNEIESVRVVKNGSQDVTDNYTITAYPGLLTVTKREVTVEVVGATVSATYDGEEHTASGYDISTEDELYDIEAKTIFGGTDEVARTDAGKSEMGLKATDFMNIDEYFEVAYAITDGWVDIEAADISAGEEGDFVLTLGANPKYNGTVQTIEVKAVTFKGLPVTYALAGENATHAGTYTLTVKGSGNFTGERSTTWQILKRQVTLTSGSASRTYNGQPLVNGDVTVSGDGFIGVEGATFEVTGSRTVAGSSKNAFTYTLKAGTLEGDYDITKVEGDLIVTKAKYPGQEEGGPGIQWNVAADAATWMYDGKTHGVTLTGVPAGVTPHLTGASAKDVGEYTASVTFDFDAANYEPPKAPASIKWSVTARPLSLQTVNAEKPYDGFPLTVDPANITPGLSGYAEGECFDYFDLASITEVGETPATFRYRDSASAKVSNYAVTVVGGATLRVTVGGDQISVTARDGTWAYDGADHRKPEWDIVNGDKLLAGHEFQIKISDDSVVSTPEDGLENNGIVSNRFEYVKIVEIESGADKTKNYNLFVYEGKLQVTNACVNAGQLKGTDDIEKTYDGESTNVTVTAELLQPATVRYGESADDISSTAGPEFVDAGEHVVWYTVAAQYYDTYTNKVVVKIDKRPITLTSPTKSKPFDGTALTFADGEIEIGGDGYAEGESFAFSNFASIADAGRVNATFDYAAGPDTDLDNYEVTVEKGTLTVNASADEITVTAKSGSWPYDGEDHVLHEAEVENGKVLQDGDELVVEYDPASKVTTPDDGEVENKIRSVRVMRGGEDGEDVTKNYTIVSYPGKIRVVNATMTPEQVKVTSEECMYDGAGHTIGVETVGLLTSPVTVVYSTTGEGSWKLDPMAVAVKNAGTHTIRYRVSAKYYDDYFGEATVKINPRPVTLISGSATKKYDGTPLRKNVVSVKEGSLDFVDGEGVMATCTSAQTGVGRIENGFTYEFKDGTLKDNYTITPEFGWLEVTPGKLTVDVEKSSYSGCYDGQPHSVKPVFEGTGLNIDACEIFYALVPNDESAYKPAMPTFTDVGTYTVYVKIKAQNFEVVYAEMTVLVTNRPVTLTSPTKKKDFDGEPLTFAADEIEIGGEGYANGESFVFSDFASIVNEGSVAATFSYAAGSGTLLSNYDVSVVTGSLTVVNAVPPEPTDWEMIPTDHGCGEYAFVENWTMAVTNPPNIFFDLPTCSWRLGFVVRWPGGAGRYQKPEDARFRISTDGREYTCAEILAGGYAGYDYLSVQTNRNGYVESVAWEVLITPEDVYEGLCLDGLTDLTYTMTATAGESTKVFGLVIPLGNLELIDINGYRVYPVHLHTWKFTRYKNGGLGVVCVSDPFLELDCPYGDEEFRLRLGPQGKARYPYRGDPIELQIDGLDEFEYFTGAYVGGIVYYKGGIRLDGAPVYSGVYEARATVYPMGAAAIEVVREFEIVGGPTGIQTEPAFAKWATKQGLTSAQLDGSKYLKASFDLDTLLLDGGRLEIVGLSAAEGTMRFRIHVIKNGVTECLKPAKEAIARYVRVSSGQMGEFEAIAPERVSVDDATGEVMIVKAPARTCECLTVVIPPDEE